MGIRRTHSRLKSPGPHGGTEDCRLPVIVWESTNTTEMVRYMLISVERVKALAFLSIIWKRRWELFPHWRAATHVAQYCSKYKTFCLQFLILQCYVMLGYDFTPYQQLWLYNGAPLVAFYDMLGIRRTYSRLKPPASSRGDIAMTMCYFSITILYCLQPLQEQQPQQQQHYQLQQQPLMYLHQPVVWED